MDKRRVGQTKLEIDSLGLGGAPLGGNFADLGYAQAEELIQAAKNTGIGYFDTAPWYGFGRSERVMGDVLRGSEYILSDKVGRLLAPGPVKNPADCGMVDPLPFNVIYDQTIATFPLSVSPGNVYNIIYFQQGRKLIKLLTEYGDLHRGIQIFNHQKSDGPSLFI